MLDGQNIISSFDHKRPYASRLVRLLSQASGHAAMLDALAGKLIEKGFFTNPEWRAKLNETWRRDFTSVAMALWERLGAAEEGHVCKTECGARCCHSACLILSPREAAVLRRQGQELGVEVTFIGQDTQEDLGDRDPEAESRWMLPAFPCAFLGTDRRCQVYPDRPIHCQLHPSFWRDDCPLSQLWFHEETSIPRLPLDEPFPDLLERLAQLTRPR